MGAGFLGMPWGMEQAGIGMGIVILLTVTTILYFTATFLLDAMARAEALTRFVYLALGAADVPAGARPRSYGSLHVPEDDIVMQEEGNGVSSMLQNAVAAERAVAAREGSPQESNTRRAFRRVHEDHVGTNDSVTRLRSASAGHPGSRLLAPLQPLSELRRPGPTATNSDSGGGDDEDDETALLTPEPQHPGDPPVFRLSHRKFELVELVEIFLGKRFKVAYLLIVALYIMGALWSYASVFGEAFATHVPVPFVHSERGMYIFYESVFGVVVLVMACFDLREQKWVQIFMTFVRVTIITVMFTTVVIAMATHDDKAFGKDQSDFEKRHIDASYVLFGKHGITAGGLSRLIPIAIYSQLFHTGVAVLAQPVQNKAKVHNVFFYTYSITASMYIIASVVIALYFGHNVSNSANLNWRHYDGNGARIAVSYLVVLFPALDVLSVTPINIITLASNLIGAIYGERAAKVEAEQRWTVIGFRLLCGIPPVVGAVLDHKLTTVLDYTGILGLLICMVMPAVVWERSWRVENYVWGSDHARDAIPRLPWESGGRWTRNTETAAESDRVLFRSAASWILGGPKEGEQEHARQQSREGEFHSGMSPAIEMRGQEAAGQDLIPHSSATVASRLDALEGMLTTAPKYSLQHMPKSPYGGFWSKVWWARAIFVLAWVVMLFTILGMGNVFGKEPKSES